MGTLKSSLLPPNLLPFVTDLQLLHRCAHTHTPTVILSWHRCFLSPAYKLIYIHTWPQTYNIVVTHALSCFFSYSRPSSLHVSLQPWLSCTHMHKQYFLHTDIYNTFFCTLNKSHTVGVHTHNIFKCAPLLHTHADWFRHVHNFTRELHHWSHLFLMHTLPLICTNCMYTHIRREAVVHRNTPPQTHTEKELFCGVQSDLVWL